MSTDWVQVVAALVVGVGVGTVMLFNADAIAGAQRSLAKSMKQPDQFAKRLTPGLVRAGGVGFIVIGLIGAFMGLFFADAMN